MAEFRYQKSEVAHALDRLQGLAENLISAETNRRIQVGQEKEARVAAAYKYLIGKEEEQIQGYEATIDSVEQNLLDRGIELESVKDEYKTIASEELLTAANEGALTMLQSMLTDSQNQSDSYQNKMREVNKVKRYIDLFDDAVSLVDPAAFGDPHKVDALDVAKAAMAFTKGKNKYAPEIEQRLKQLQTEGELERLQEDYYARLGKDVEEKITATTAKSIDSQLTIQALEPAKKESHEAIVSMLNRNDTMYQMGGQLASMKLNMEDLAVEDLTTTEINEKEAEIEAEKKRLGSYLYPWAGEASSDKVNDFFAAWSNAKDGNFNLLVQYFKEGNAKFILMPDRERAERYRTEFESMFGVDIADDNWIANIEKFLDEIFRVDFEQGVEQLKISQTVLPESTGEGSRTEVELLLEEQW